MPKRMTITGRPFVHMLVGSIVAGFTVQAEWAVDHDFEQLDARIFASALAIFIIVHALRLVLLRTTKAGVAGFDEAYGEMVLLLCLFPAFLIIDNALLRIAAFLAYAAIVVRYASDVLGVGWCVRLREWLARLRAGLPAALAGRRLGYSIQDDIDRDVLHVALYLKADYVPAADEIKRRVAALYQDLPESGGFQSMRVNVDGVGRVDATLARFLEPLSQYAALMNIDTLVVAGPAEHVSRLEDILPAGPFTVEASGGR